MVPVLSSEGLLEGEDPLAERTPCIPIYGEEQPLGILQLIDKLEDVTDDLLHR